MSTAAPRELRLAKRMARLGTETAFEVLVKARALEAKGRDIVHLEIGEPDFDTPANIIGAATDALQHGHTHYGPSAGLPQLRETIAQYVSETRRVTATPEEVVVVPGGKPIIFFTILALVEEGDEVIYPNPGFPIYESMIDFLGAKAVPIPLHEEMDFRFDVDQLAGLINEGSLHPARRIFQDLRDDRLADGLRRDARRSRDARRAVDDELQFLHRQLYADGRNRGVARAAGIGR